MPCAQHRLEGHRHYVQGVAWDPLGAWLVSQSADRSVRVHGLKPPAAGAAGAALLHAAPAGALLDVLLMLTCWRMWMRANLSCAGGKGSKGSTAAAGVKGSAELAKDYVHTHTLAKRALPPPGGAAEAAAAAAAAAPAAGPDSAVAGDAAAVPQHPQARPLQAFMFQDEALNVFFRRLAWSPDGEPGGLPTGCLPCLLARCRCPPVAVLLCSLLAVLCCVAVVAGALLAVPAGLFKAAADQPAVNATYLYARGHW